MEPQPQDLRQETSLFELQVDENSAANLSSAASWAKFIAIACFIGMGILIIAFTAMKDSYVTAFRFFLSESTSGSAIIVVILILALLVVIALMSLLMRGAILIKRGIQTSDQQTFNSGLGSLKAYFTMYGVIAIIAFLLKLLGLLSK